MDQLQYLEYWISDKGVTPREKEHVTPERTKRPGVFEINTLVKLGLFEFIS